jgi:hypothetical protein
MASLDADWEVARQDEWMISKETEVATSSR